MVIPIPNCYTRFFISFLYNYKSIRNKISDSLIILFDKIGIGATIIRNLTQLMFSLTKKYFWVRVNSRMTYVR